MKSLSVLLPLILSAGTCVLGGGFANSCSDVSFAAPSILKATCPYGEYRVTSTLDLKRCLTNSNGNLKCPGSDFIGSCTNCVLQPGNVLSCQCRNARGTTIPTKISLNDCVSNVNGGLRCP